ncbi:uncharacterized protein B0I36DRAFT_367770 [Microdochium trichocladiopsis]|uniref:Mid2 domain-containing protein n=1 Tax=Microdochium trichocladiopsis TaxID=1682393 RepID=A0A9P8XZE0_9PEZI|nr:uncharacterized protein B0I36DRAFT_367770 [Microdochium trichocladiopsis]KAH7021353.1 hypothetical protein B0I36DRAFT_367770 [Microdochium trichocladiopsis]
MAFPFLICFYCLVQLISGQSTKPVDYSNRFIWPPLPGPPANLDGTAFYENPNIEYGKPQSRPFTFITSMASTTIYMYQEQSPALAKFHLIRDCEPNNAGNSTTLHYWDGNIGDIDVELTNVAFLIAYECDDIGSPKFFSHYFNLTRAASLSTSATLATTVPTAGPSGTGTLTGPSTVVPTASVPTDANNSAASNTAALAGGIGGGIGGALLLIAAGFAFWKYRQRGKEQQQQAPPAYGYPSHDQSSAGGTLRSMTTSPAYNAYGPPYQYNPNPWNQQAFLDGTNPSAAYNYKNDHSGPPPAQASMNPVELAGDNHPGFALSWKH